MLGLTFRSQLLLSALHDIFKASIYIRMPWQHKIADCADASHFSYILSSTSQVPVPSYLSALSFWCLYSNPTVKSLDNSLHFRSAAKRVNSSFRSSATSIIWQTLASSMTFFLCWRKHSTASSNYWSRDTGLRSLRREEVFCSRTVFRHCVQSKIISRYAFDKAWVRRWCFSRLYIRS